VAENGWEKYGSGSDIKKEVTRYGLLG